VQCAGVKKLSFRFSEVYIAQNQPERLGSQLNCTRASPSSPAPPRTFSAEMKLQIRLGAAASSEKLLPQLQRTQFAARSTKCAPRTLSCPVLAADSSGLTSSNSNLLGPSLNLGGPSLGSMSGSKAAPAVSLEDVPLESGTGVDYAPLQNLLKEGKWREAEDETRAKLIEAAGPGAQQRGWVYWSEVHSIPEEDMRTLDALWAAASGGKFGYRKQRDLWVQNRRQWTKFFKAIKWVQGENNIYLKWPTEFVYSLEAVPGHLPLTNALRGTRLFEAIMEHPAIAESKNKASGDSNGAGNSPSWLK
jgi:hypothetical protein